MYKIILQLPYNGFHVKATLSLPVQARSLVIFAHGLNNAAISPHEIFLSKELQQAGFGTLNFDFLDEQDGLPEEYRKIELMSHGLLSSTQWLHNHFEYRDFELAYLGSGTGAAIALKAASENGTAIKTVACLGGRLDLVKEDLKQVAMPILLVVGELDFRISEINRQALEVLKASKQLAVIPGASHLFDEPGKASEVARILISWFKKQLAWNRQKTFT